MSPFLGTFLSLNVNSYGFFGGKQRINITSQPVQLSSYTEGTSTTLSITATVDTGTISYQWQKQESGTTTWSSIVGETNTSYTTSSFSYANDNGDSYRCLLTPSASPTEPVSSNSVLINVRRVITITSQPTTQYILENTTGTFTVIASISSGTISYQWQSKQDGSSTWNDISGANSSSYTTGTFLYSYRCVLSNSAANMVITSEVRLEISTTDFTITPSINGITNWNLVSNGPLIMDANSATTYTIVAQRSFSTTVKMWGQGRSTNTGGYSNGTVNFTNGTTYTVRLNAGGGSSGTNYGWVGGENGGGYAGLFITNSITQENAIMMAGGAGGGGFGHGTSSGGFGGGSSGGNGTNSANTQIGSTGGGGGTQSSGGGGGGAGGSSGGALQGGRGGDGQQNGYPNAGGGGGGGGGYYGGGGGGGGNDNGGTTRDASGGGGGSGYINATYVSEGSTGNYQDSTNRGTAGEINGPARVVIQ